MSGRSESPRRLHGVPNRAPEGREALESALVAAGRGDEAAFTEVYRALAPSVYGLARRVIRDPAMAEETAQDVFVQVWRFAARFDPAKGSARTWVMTLTHRRAVDVVRSEVATARRERAMTAQETPFDSVHEEAVASLEGQQVRRCLDDLTDIQRESITLAYYNGYTYGQVAAALGANPSTVKTRMRDGLGRLRDCLNLSGVGR